VAQRRDARGATRTLDLEHFGLGELRARAGRDGPPVAPLDRRLLLGSGNPPATAELPVDQLDVASARLVRARSGAGKRVTLTRSDEYEDYFLLPETLEPADGLPGRREQIIQVKARSRRASRVRRSREVAVHEAPPWVPLGLHPIPVFDDSPLEGKLRDGRRLRLSANHIAIYGADNRINIYPTTYPECCVCRIAVYTQATSGGSWDLRKRGTGFLVGPRHLMTSGHMRPVKPYAGWKIKVIPAYWGRMSVFGASFLSYASDLVAYHSDVGDDFMVCRLYDAIGDTAGYFGARTYDSDWEDMSVWSMTGYPYDIGEWRPTYQGSIAVVDDDDGDNIELPNGDDRDTTQIESYADEASGASGSPMYSWFTNGELYAIGVHHGRETDWGFWGSDTHSVASGGSGFVGLIKWARKSWP
jgi:hypothetical protein